MKYLITGLIIIVGGAFTYNLIGESNIEEYENTATSTATSVGVVEESLYPDEVENEASKAMQAVYRKYELEQSLNAVTGEISALKATYEANLAELVAEKEDIEKQLDVY